jgi:hypothetical protein
MSKVGASPISNMGQKLAKYAQILVYRIQLFEIPQTLEKTLVGRGLTIL